MEFGFDSAVNMQELHIMQIFGCVGQNASNPATIGPYLILQAYKNIINRQPLVVLLIRVALDRTLRLTSVIIRPTIILPCSSIVSACL